MFAIYSLLENKKGCTKIAFGTASFKFVRKYINTCFCYNYFRC